jgi:peptidoglycan/LPS O-acetylase OafA/YrhL
MKRMPALDGLRGLLALFVCVDLFACCQGNGSLMPYANYCVYAFFTMSALVLVRGWNGSFPLFLIRRVARLWPVYALCLAVGYLAPGKPLHMEDFMWGRLLDITTYPTLFALPDPPAWSMVIEARAMLFMPFLVWVGRGHAWRVLAAILAWLVVLLVTKEPSFVFGIFFIIGAALARFHFSFKPLEWQPAQWLGKISYSLYLSHCVVLAYLQRWLGPDFILPAIVLIPAVAWVLCEYVEQPSIRLSRYIGDVAKGYAGMRYREGAMIIRT